MGKTFLGAMSAAVEQSRRKVNIVTQGDGKKAKAPYPASISPVACSTCIAPVLKVGLSWVHGIWDALHGLDDQSLEWIRG